MMNREQPAAIKPLSYWRRRVFVIAWLTYASYYLGRVNLAVALPSLRADLGWSKAVAGLIGSLFYWVYATGQLVNGQLGDRVSARRMVGLGLAASGLINIALAFPLVRSSALSSQLVLAAMLVLWLANGWMQSTGWGPIVKTLSLWFSPQERGRVTALFNPCYVAGHAAAWALAGALIARHGWRAAFGGPGALLLIIAALWYLLLPERAPEDREQPLKPALSLAGVVRGLREVAALPQMRWTIAICFLSGMVKDGLTLWGPTYLVEAQGLSLSTAALTATLIPIAGIFGTILGGVFLHGRGHGSEMRIVIGFALTLALGAVALYHFGDDHRVALAVAALALIAASSYGINALLMSALPLSLGPRGKVSAAAGTLDFISYLGGGLSATLIGGIEETWGWGAVYSIWVGIALAIGALAWISRRRRAPTDTARSD